MLKPKAKKTRSQFPEEHHVRPIEVKKISACIASSDKTTEPILANRNCNESQPQASLQEAAFGKITSVILSLVPNMPVKAICARVRLHGMPPSRVGAGEI